ncbi:YoaP domain-containing protein [Clostridium sp. Marseille-P2415]|uniref:YoaP domain-containing protein n=1 Tax=Clostridium sp. Marseille-P2415 TaxID=1805471 RepID=UPI0009883290|nr:YoaP domain-containing protein [Clostridium sp. Marseille-P2415]
MEIITLSKENLEQEHICCAIANNKDCQVAAKKAWLAERLEEGLVFKKGNVRGKCFIEYIPAEKAWAPIDAAGYMYINCFWVSGQFKGQGNSNLLLEACIEDSREKGKKGLVILSSKKKLPYLSDPKYLRHKGFELADTAEPYYELLYLPFINDADKPGFKQSVRERKIMEPGFVLYYSHQCPFTAKYVPLIEAAAEKKGIPFQSIRFESAKEAQNAPAPFTTYSLFYNGTFLTNEILSEKRFEKMFG